MIINNNSITYFDTKIPLLEIGALYKIQNLPLYFYNKDFFSNEQAIPIGEVIMPISYFDILEDKSFIVYNFLYKTKHVITSIQKLSLKFNTQLEKVL